MLVFVATGAFGRETGPGAIEVFGFQQGAHGGGNVLRIVTGTTPNPDVLAVNPVARLRVIESSGARIPMDHGELFTVVVGMAFYASGARRPGLRILCMESFVQGQLGRNFGVAIQAMEGGRLSRDGVALHAVARTVKLFVRRC